MPQPATAICDTFTTASNKNLTSSGFHILASMHESSMLAHELSTKFVGLGSPLNREVGFMSCTPNSYLFVLKVKGFVGSMNGFPCV
jgi:hypothetical protein